MGVDELGPKDEVAVIGSEGDGEISACLTRKGTRFLRALLSHKQCS